MQEQTIHGVLEQEPVSWHTYINTSSSKEMVFIVDFFIRQDNGSLILSRATNNRALKVLKLKVGDFLKTKGFLSIRDNEITYMIEEIIKAKR